MVDTSKLRIGEQVNVDLFVNYKSNQKISIQWPSIGDTITEKIEVVSKSEIDTMLPNKNDPSFIQQHQRIRISIYDSGFYVLPSFKFIINNDTTNIKKTVPIVLEVHTVPTDSSATKIKDIKPIFEEKFNWKWYLPIIYWAAGTLLAILAIVLITIYLNNKSKHKIIEPPKPKIPAHITALAALEKIKESQIWKQGSVKEYYSSITDTIRLYIEERFEIMALESTSDEIIKAFRSQVVDNTSKEKLQQLLQLSDLVKFAKMTPIESEHNIALQAAFDFVNGTKRDTESTEIKNSSNIESNTN